MAPDHPEIVIDIINDGRIRIEDQNLSEEELLAKLKPTLEEFPNCPIRIRADGEVRYEDVLKVIEQCRAAGAWNLTFADAKTKEE